MAEYKWPEESKRTHIGKRISRIDGPDKVSGRAKYTFDMNRPGMLFGKVVRSPYAHAKVVSIDTSVAEKMPGGLPPGMPGAPGMPAKMPCLPPNFPGGLPGMGPKMPGLGGFPGLGKKK